MKFHTITALVLVLVLAGCDRDDAESTPKQTPPKPPEPVYEPAVSVELCRVMSTEVPTINLWERPTPKDAVGIVDRGGIRGQALAGQQVSVSFETSTSYFVDAGDSSGWVSKDFAPTPCFDESAPPSIEMTNFVAKLDGSTGAVQAALKEFGANETIQRHEMGKLRLSSPQILGKADNCYTFEAELGDSLRTYDVCWSEGKINEIVDKGVVTF